MTPSAFVAPLSLRGLSTGPAVSHASSRCPVVATATSPASTRVRRSENVPGLAPDTFRSENGQSAVHAQPKNPDETLMAARAASSCPTGSIRTEEPTTASRAAISSFPLSVENIPLSTPVPLVFYNGFASPDTFGGASWLLLHDGPDRHAVMFDCPRFFRPLAKAIRRLAEPYGGVKYLVLSHKDDVVGHAQWAEALGAKRVIHRKECNTWQGTVDCEVQLEDEQFPYNLADGVELVHVPGHTDGSIAMLHERSQSLFTGDHLAYSARVGTVSGFPQFISHSWGVQIRSVEKLAELPFLHMWPAHGRHFHFANGEERQKSIIAAADFMSTLKSRLP